MGRKQKLLIIVGPTASGKSALAVELAKKFGGEIISADSRQVYKSLDIGTGKITKREMRGVRHHLLDVISPKKTFTANDFVILATDAIAQVTHRGKLPIVVGGTGFYIDALVGRIKFSNVPPDEKLRDRLEKQPAQQLFALLKKQDPKRAKTIDPHNKRRLIRALEIAHSSSKTRVLRTRRVLNRYDALWIGIAPPSEKLHTRIKHRIRGWIRRGLIQEVKNVRKSGVSWKRLHEFGFEYSLVADHLRGKLSKRELPIKMESATWRYTRKQMGYWRRNKEIRWFARSDSRKISRAIRSWFKV